MTQRRKLKSELSEIIQSTLGERLLIDQDDARKAATNAASLIHKSLLPPPKKAQLWRHWRKSWNERTQDSKITGVYSKYLVRDDDQLLSVVKARQNYKTRMSAKDMFENVVRLIPSSYITFPADAKRPTIKQMKTFLSEKFTTQQAAAQRKSKTQKSAVARPILPVQQKHAQPTAQSKSISVRQTEQQVLPDIPVRKSETTLSTTQRNSKIDWTLPGYDYQDPDLPRIKSLCDSFVGKSVYIWAHFDGGYVDVANCNAVGDLFENIFFDKFKQEFPFFRQGPLQGPPDYWNHNKYAYEQKCFMCSPGFDIANFDSFVNEIHKEEGLVSKLFQTKYLVFGYEMIKREHPANPNQFIIRNFHLLNIWNLVGYDGKYPLTIQNKKGHWYNIRPSEPKHWYSKDKTPTKFVEHLIKAIRVCPNKDIQENKASYENNILRQWQRLQKHIKRV